MKIDVQIDPPQSVAECSLPAALQVMGERWSFLILRGAFGGICHFEQFHATLGIARNILSNRLARLVCGGILERRICNDDRRKVIYGLTPKGEALLPVLLALRQWGEKWEAGHPANPVLVDCRDRRPVETVCVRATDGRPLELADLMWLDRAEIS